MYRVVRFELGGSYEAFADERHETLDQGLSRFQRECNLLVRDGYRPFRPRREDAINRGDAVSVAREFGGRILRLRLFRYDYHGVGGLESYVEAVALLKEAK